MTTRTETTTSVIDAAHEAWARKADLDMQAAVNSLRSQLLTKLRIKRDTYSDDTDMFPWQFEPALRVGVEIDGQVFCLNGDRALAAVVWRCAQKDCNEIARFPVRDFVSLGRALAWGAYNAEVSPKCKAHGGKL